MGARLHISLVEIALLSVCQISPASILLCHISLVQIALLSVSIDFPGSILLLSVTLFASTTPSGGPRSVRCISVRTIYGRMLYSNST